VHVPDVEIFSIPDIFECFDDVGRQVRVLPVELSDLLQDFVTIALVEVGVDQLSACTNESL
jgi:hypothetical protein